MTPLSKWIRRATLAVAILIVTRGARAIDPETAGRLADRSVVESTPAGHSSSFDQRAGRRRTNLEPVATPSKPQSPIGGASQRPTAGVPRFSIVRPQKPTGRTKTAKKKKSWFHFGH